MPAQPMGDAIQCQLCEKVATVHLTQIVNSKIHKVDLCEDCAQEKGVTDPDGFSLAELLGKAGEGGDEGGGPAASGDLICEQCGLTQKDFRNQGRLGCPSCYEAFAPVLDPMLANLQINERHAGKWPRVALARAERTRQLNEMHRRLDEAVQGERFEEAARWRDEIEALAGDGSKKNPPEAGSGSLELA